MVNCALTDVYQTNNGGAIFDVESGAALQDTWTSGRAESGGKPCGEKVSNDVGDLAACKDMSVTYCVS